MQVKDGGPARYAVYISLGIDETYLRIGDVGRRNPRPELIQQTLVALAELTARSQEKE